MRSTQTFYVISSRFINDSIMSFAALPATLSLHVDTLCAMPIIARHHRCAYHLSRSGASRSFGSWFHRALRRCLPLFLPWALLPAGCAGQDTSAPYDPNANSPLRVLLQQPDQKLLIAGSFTGIAGVSASRACGHGAHSTNLDVRSPR